MNDLIDSVKTILQDETGTGEVLEEFTIVESFFDSMKGNAIVIQRDQSDILKWSLNVEYVRSLFSISVVRNLKRYDYDNWILTQRQAEIDGRNIRQIFANNPTLITATFPDGIIKCGETINFLSIEPFDYNESQNGWYIGVKINASVELIYRDSIIVRN